MFWNQTRGHKRRAHPTWLSSAVVGAAVGAVAGAVGHRIAVGSAAAAARRGTSVPSAINREDRFGSLGGALSGLGLGGFGNGLGSSGFANGLGSGGK